MEETYELPPPERRERLVAALGRLVAQRGFETLVCAPTLEPTAEYFPDRWTPNVGGVRTLIQRLLSYAGLAELEVDLEIFDSRIDPIPHGDGHRNVAAWYAGVDEGRLRFGLDVQQARDPVQLTGVLAHEVAHAYREHHALVTSDSEIEEPLTDLTTVYLGFGVFSVSSAFYSQSVGSIHGAMVSTEYRIGTLGYLAAGEMAFLLAARSVARDDDARQSRKVQSLLPANQAHAFGLALKELKEDPSGLRELLGVPSPDQFPKRERLELEAIEPEPRDGDDIGLSSDDGSEEFDTRRPTFRVKKTMRGVFAFIGATGGFVLGAIAFGNESMTPALVLCGLGGVGMAFAGAGIHSYRCADPVCDSSVERADQRCEGCGRTIVGELTDANQRLDAEERWQEERKKLRHRERTGTSSAP